MIGSSRGVLGYCRNQPFMGPRCTVRRAWHLTHGVKLPGLRCGQAQCLLLDRHPVSHIQSRAAHDRSPLGRDGVKSHPETADDCDVVVTGRPGAVSVSVGWLGRRLQARATSKLHIRADTPHRASIGSLVTCSCRL
jgi:hypothetical protein